MVKRVIIHMGFPKTGTSSLQAYLRMNRKDLQPYAKITLGPAFKDARFAGQEFAEFPSFGRLRKFRKAMRSLFESQPDFHTLVLSRESLSGIMPGFRRYGFHRARRVNPIAKILAKVTVQEARAVFGTEAEIILLYTIREKEAWLSSAWGHVLRAIKLTENREQFVKAYKGNPLEKEVAIIQRAVKQADVRAVALEEVKDLPAGPATAILDMIGVPRAFGETHPMKRVQNQGPTEELLTHFLEMNRSELKGEQLRLQKEKLYDDLRESRGFKRQHTTPNGRALPPKPKK